MSRSAKAFFLIFLLCSIHIWAQDSDAVLQAFQKNFVRGNLTTKIQVLQDAILQSEIDMGPLYLQSLDFVIDNADIFENDLVARELAVLSIRLIGLAGHRNALFPLWELFVLDSTRTVRIEILNAIGGLIPIDNELVLNINGWLQTQNEKLRRGEDVDAEVLEEAVVTLGKIGDDSSFPVLFTVSILGGSNEIDEKAREALYSIEGDFKELILRVIEKNSLQEKLEALRIGLANDDLFDRHKGQIAEVALKKGLYEQTTQAADREFLRQLRYESIRVLTELSWSQATTDAVAHFEKTLEEQAIGIGRTFHVIEAVECLGSMASHEAAVRLALYLDILNSDVENGKDVEDDIVLSVIRSLGALGDIVAFDYLLYAGYLDYSDSIKKAARESLNRL
ncbi:MAG: hypothetical protein CMN78_05450 [Spirochaetales bacterium]|nr:hypothetical protein [Spirochaetales bacterium]